MLTLEARYALLIFGVILTLAASSFIFSTFKVHSLQKMVLSKTTPSIESEKMLYYTEVFSILERTIDLERGDSSGYAKKADYLWKALDDGLEHSLNIDRSQIEGLYKKAIRLNPVSYEHHLKLGWFLFEEGDILRAEEELLRAVNLYPTEYQTHFYLVSYYFKSKKEWQGFKTFLLFLTYRDDPNERVGLLYSSSNDLQDLSLISVSRDPNLITYTFSPNAEEFNFREKDFSTKLLPIKVRVHMKQDVSDVTLYKNYVPYLEFKKIELDGVSRYEIDLISVPRITHLDDFRIEANPRSLIKKVEIIKEF